MDLMQDIIARAKADKQRIVLPEGTEERTLKAADRLLADGVADIILIGNPAEIKELAAGFGLNHIGEATLVDPKITRRKPRMQTCFSNFAKEGYDSREGCGSS